jgi:hypothetical protein
MESPSRWGEISYSLLESCSNVVDGDDFEFLVSQKDKELMVESSVNNRNSTGFVVSEVSEVLIDTLPVRLWSSVYSVVAVRPFASWLFVGKQTEQLVSTFNNRLWFFELHDESIIEFDPGGGASSCLMLFVFTVL